MSSVGRISEDWNSGDHPRGPGGKFARALSIAPPLDPRDAGGDGDCYSAAYGLVHKLGGNWKLAHGSPTGQGPISGIKFGHAWVENKDTVIDPSNGGMVTLPKVAYYALGHIDPAEVKLFSPKEADAQAVRTGHYGPWA